MSANGLTPECARPGCDYEAAWTPVILIPSPKDKPSQKPGRLIVKKHNVCQAHKESLRITDFFGAGGWGILKFQINAMGKTPPKEEDLLIEWQPILRVK